MIFDRVARNRPLFLMPDQSINMTQLRNCPIPVPPPDEQNSIVAKVDQLMVLCDQLENKLKQTQTTSEKLVEATVKSLVA